MPTAYRRQLNSIHEQRHRRFSSGYTPKSTEMASVSCGDHTTITIFGALGDLAKKKTFPALFGLFREGELPENTKILGYARSKYEQDKFKERIRPFFKKGNTQKHPDYDAKVEKFLSMVSYVSGQYDGSDDGYDRLEKEIAGYEAEKNTSDDPHRIFYLALPPAEFTTVAGQLKKYCYPGKGIFRLVVEKPFGHDLQSARELQEQLAPLYTEDELYRIDHYLGKEMVKNLLVLRFGNEILGGLWNKNHIKLIQISFKELFGTQGRGGYFDTIGIVRDVMQNHLLQVLTLLTMERPVSFDPEAVRDEKVKVLKAFDAINVDDVIIGQYTALEDGKEPGYLDDDSVENKNSNTATYCALGMQIHNERWEGVPIVMRAGKALNESKVEIRIQYKPVAKGMFETIQRNELVIRIQPDEAVYLKINNKIPGISTKTSLTDLDLTYAVRYSDDFWIPDAYEALIRDVFLGNHANFVRDDELDVSWLLFTPFLEHIEGPNAPKPHLYSYGSKGPKNLREFLGKHGYVFADEGIYEWPVITPAVADVAEKL